MVQLLRNAPEAAAWLRARVGARSGAQGTLRSDSRALRPGDAFMAVPGQRHDARRFVPDALAAGAAACLVEAQGVDTFAFDDLRVAALPGLKAASGLVADAYLDQPSARLDVIASTGTNGKTSTAWWMAQALTILGRRCGVVGTLGIGEPPLAGADTAGQPAWAGAGAAGEAPAAGAAGKQFPTDAGAAVEPGRVEPTGLTTPDAVALHGALRRFADRGFAACALEASSIGITEHRLAGVRIKLALFTNFTRDHLDFHGDMATYWAAKRALFDWHGLQAAVVNVDDAHGVELADVLANKPTTQERADGLTAKLGGMPVDLWTVSLAGPARLSAQSMRHTGGGLAFDVCEGSTVLPLASQLVGQFNASNLLVVLAGLRALGVPLADAVAAAAQLTPVPGRLQRVVLAGADIEVLVDYAHTPDALQKALDALRPLATARGGRLWCVFGCGGNRDATKRPLMGAIAAANADRVVVTSDNPRDEVPDAILAQILVGVTGMSGHDQIDVIEDRRAAIAHAVGSACSGDVLLLAGKGHEDYQETAGVKRPFSDSQEALTALRLRAGVEAAA